jgi:hypothetical protein
MLRRSEQVYQCQDAKQVELEKCHTGLVHSRSERSDRYSGINYINGYSVGMPPTFR